MNMLGLIEAHKEKLQPRSLDNIVVVVVVSNNFISSYHINLLLIQFV